MRVDINLAEVKRLVKEGYISERKHPEADLYIYNYTPKTQYEKYWTPETKACRGLILDALGNVVARPFPKFFNLQEHEGTLPEGPFTILEKLDGSLGILYWLRGKPYLASRGSFTSEQALKGTEILQLYDCSGLNKKYTYLFEIIYPENRIVVDYGDRETIVLLAVINTETGEELPTYDFPHFFDLPKIYDVRTDIKILHEINQEKNKEGFVLVWDNGFRLKFKFDEYVRLHRIITQTTARTIWEHLKEERPLKELLENVPDEFYKWVKIKVGEFKKQYDWIYLYAREQAKKAKAGTSIKNIAKESIDYYDLQKLNNELRKNARTYFEEHEDICWMFFNNQPGKKIKEKIWDKLYPPHETPFREEV